MRSVGGASNPPTAPLKYTTGQLNRRSQRGDRRGGEVGGNQRVVGTQRLGMAIPLDNQPHRCRVPWIGKSQQPQHTVFEDGQAVVTQQRLVGRRPQGRPCWPHVLFRPTNGLFHACQDQRQIVVVHSAVQKRLAPNANHVRALVVVRAGNQHVVEVGQPLAQFLDGGKLQTDQVDRYPGDLLRTALEHHAPGKQRIVNSRRGTSRIVPSQPDCRVGAEFGCDVDVRKTDRQIIVCPYHGRHQRQPNHQPRQGRDIPGQPSRRRPLAG